MTLPATQEIRRRLHDSNDLDLLYGETMGLPTGDTKERPLRALAALLRLLEEHPEVSVALPDLRERLRVIGTKILTANLDVSIGEADDYNMRVTL